MNKKHEHRATASNSRESASTFIGCSVKGVLTAVRERGSHHSSAFTLVFDCGWGLSVLPNGSYFVTSPETIKAHVADLKAELHIAGLAE